MARRLMLIQELSSQVKSLRKPTLCFRLCSRQQQLVLTRHPMCSRSWVSLKAKMVEMLELEQRRRLPKERQRNKLLLKPLPARKKSELKGRKLRNAVVKRNSRESPKRKRRELVSNRRKKRE